MNKWDLVHIKWWWFIYSLHDWITQVEVRDWELEDWIKWVMLIFYPLIDNPKKWGLPLWLLDNDSNYKETDVDKMIKKDYDSWELKRLLKNKWLI